MKKAFLMCIIGLLCIAGYSYAENLNVYGYVTAEGLTIRNMINADAMPLTFTATLVNGSNVAFSDAGSAPYFPGVNNGDTIVIGTEVFVAGNSWTNILQLNRYYNGDTTSGLPVYIVPPAFTIDSMDAQSNLVNSLGSMSRKLIVTTSGNVGIGLSNNPAYKLHVGGDAYVTGTLYAVKSLGTTGMIGGGTLAVNTSITFGYNAKQKPPTGDFKALCYGPNGFIGYCTSAINASGACNCVAIK